MKRKHFLLKALLCSAVLAAVPFAAQSVSAESADAAAPMAVQAEDGTTTTTTSYATTTSLTTTTTYFATATLPATPPPLDGTSSTTSTTQAFVIQTDENGSTITTTSDSTLTTTTSDDGKHLTDIDVKVSADTIKVGEKAQITVGLEPADTTDFTVFTFVSSDPEIATVDDKGVITALKEGDVTIYCTVHSSTTEIQLSVGAPEIYSVLVLDISGSMDGKPIEAEREAATKFCQDILASNNKSHIAVVALGSGSDTKILSDFSSDLGELTGVISKIDAISGTEYAQALNLADSLLSQVPDTFARSIVLCSDGEPWDTSAAKAKAEELKKKYTIYTLGFFPSYTSTSAANTLKTIASNEYGYSEVKDPKALTVQFAMIAHNVAINVEGPTITKTVDLKVEPGTTTTPAQTTTQPVQNAPAAAGVKTGDNDFIALYAVIALFGAAVVALTAKKRENN